MHAASESGPPPAGNLAIPVFESQGLEVELYEPRGIDRQSAHSRDEIYFVGRGSGRFFDGESNYGIAEGDFIFVPAGREHRFENFSDDFAVWVVFFGEEGGGG